LADYWKLHSGSVGSCASDTIVTFSYRFVLPPKQLCIQDLLAQVSLLPMQIFFRFSFSLHHTAAFIGDAIADASQSHVCWKVSCTLCKPLFTDSSSAKRLGFASMAYSPRKSGTCQFGLCKFAEACSRSTSCFCHAFQVSTALQLSSC
jgi:hypothetical protein